MRRNPQTSPTPAARLDVFFFLAYGVAERRFAAPLPERLAASFLHHRTGASALGQALLVKHTKQRFSLLLLFLAPSEASEISSCD